MPLQSHLLIISCTVLGLIRPQADQLVLHVLQDGTVSHAAGADGDAAGGPVIDGYQIPSQLQQSFLQVPAKDRLVMLAALLRQKTLLRRAQSKSNKVVVFMSSCDGVDFHYHLFKDVWGM